MFWRDSGVTSHTRSWSEYHLSSIVYGWRDAHYSMKIVLKSSIPVILRKKNAYFFAHPHVWHSTTLGSAQTARRLLRQENVSQHRPACTTHRQPSHIHVDRHIFWTNKARTIFMKHQHAGRRSEIPSDIDRQNQ